MEILNNWMEKLGLKKESTQQSPLEGLEVEGLPEYRVPLSTIKISYDFVSRTKLISPEHLQLIAEELNVPIKVVRDDLTRITKGMQKNVSICIEYPYVDEYYRDTYYSFFARKHQSYNRYCFRLSFFVPGVTKENFYDIEELEKKFLGYTVLRPTPKRIVGYTFLSPSVYKQSNYSCCLCQKAVSIMGRILRVHAFPFSGQDGEMNTCSETAVSLIFDYFSNRYNKYPRLLPSQIAGTISGAPNERKQPSKGIDIDSISALMNKYGVNTRQYLLSDDETLVGDGIHFDESDFQQLLHIYIESGFPLYAVTEKHAFVVIGRLNKLFVDEPNLVVMDDNKKPYHELQNETDIIGFIVPMAENILLEAKDIDPITVIKKVAKDYPSIGITINETGYYNRVFLTTSRSFKSYVVNKVSHQETRDVIISIAMPRFIWVCESFKLSEKGKKIDDIELDSTIILDTTDSSEEYNHLLLAKSRTYLLSPGDDRTHMMRKQYYSTSSPVIMHPFTNNLKGEHTNWEC